MNKPHFIRLNTPSLSLVCVHQVYRKAVGQMSQGLIRRLTVLSQYEEALVKINATAAERLTALKAKPHAAIQRDMLSICNDPFTVAQQLTHIELVRAAQHQFDFPTHSILFPTVSYFFNFNSSFLQSIPKQSCQLINQNLYLICNSLLELYFPD